MSNDKIIFLTGITGHLGYHVAEALIQNGYTVRALTRTRPDKTSQIAGVDYIQGDIVDPATYKDALHGAHAVIHTAAAVSFGGDFDTLMRVNFVGTKNLVEQARIQGVTRFIYVSSRGTHASSSAPAQADETVPFVNEEDADGYMKSKLMAEKYVLAASANGDIEAIVVSPTALMGGRDNKPGPAGALVRDFLNGKAKFYLDGGINVVDVHDAAAATVSALKKAKNGETYFLGGSNVTMLEIYREIASLTDRPAPRLKLPTLAAYLASYAFVVLEKVSGRPAPVTPKKVISFRNRHSYCSAVKARDGLDMPQTPLVATLKETINFFKP